MSVEVESITKYAHNDNQENVKHNSLVFAGGTGKFTITFILITLMHLIPQHGNLPSRLTRQVAYLSFGM